MSRWSASVATRRSDQDWSRRYLLAGLVGCLAAAAAFAAWGPTPLAIVLLSAIAATATGYWRRHPRRSPAWQLLVVYQVVAVARTAWLAFTGSHEPPGLTTGEVFAIASSAVGLLAIISFTAWAGGNVANSLWDAAIAAFALAMVLWAGVVDPILGTESLSGFGLLASAVFPLLALAHLVLTIRLAAVTGLRRRAQRLLVIGFGVALIANVVEGMFFAHGITDSRRVVPLALWTAAWVVLGAAVLDPGLSERPRPAPRASPSVSNIRILFFAGLTALAPALLILRWVLEPPMIKPVNGGIPAISVHLVVPVVLSSALTILLVLRSGGLARILSLQSSRLGESLTAQRRLQAQLEHRAHHDPLTGLPNRAVLHDRLSEAVGTPLPHGKEHMLLLLDLDGFKDVNDAFGHPAGDQLLRTVAERLQAATAAGATACRLGGDEFAVLLGPAAAERAWAQANAVLAALRVPYVLSDRELAVTVSIGALPLRPGMPASAALRDVDLALYAAKNAGKNQIVRYDETLGRDRQTQTALTTGLRRAVAESEFTLAYQPIVDLATGRTRALEALMRWTPPDGVPVPPSEFIPAAELAGLIVPLGDWVVRAACRDALRWHERHGVAVSVNVSGRQLAATDFADTVLTVLGSTRLPAPALIVEVTETALIAGTKLAHEVVDQLARLRRAGVRVAIDDFGTGYSSLAHLRDLPVDILKVDRRFVQDTGIAPDAERARDFTRAILELGTVLRLETIAEGIETAEQWRLLRDLGCDFGQGFHIATPTPAEEVDRMLTAPPWAPPDRQSSPSGSHSRSSE